MTLCKRREENKHRRRRCYLHSGVTSERVGVSLCGGAGDLHTILGDGSCAGVLHHGSYGKNKNEGQNDDLVPSLVLLFAPTVSVHFPLVLALHSFSPSILLHTEGLLFPPNSHHHLEANLAVRNIKNKGPIFFYVYKINQHAHSSPSTALK